MPDQAPPIDRSAFTGCRFPPEIIMPAAARTFFKTASLAHDEPGKVVTDLTQALEKVTKEQIPRAFHDTEQYANNHAECDHGPLTKRPG